MRFFSPNSYTYTLKIWTKVGELEHNAVAYLSDNDSRLTAYRNGDLTAHETRQRAIPKPMNRSMPSNRTCLKQPSNCSAADMLQAHVGTGGGGSTASDSRWDGKNPRRLPPQTPLNHPHPLQQWQQIVQANIAAILRKFLLTICRVMWRIPI